MANKASKDIVPSKGKKSKPVTKHDQSDEVVAICDHLQSLKFRPTLPYAFTEQGIGQLSSVVHLNWGTFVRMIR